MKNVEKVRRQDDHETNEAVNIASYGRIDEMFPDLPSMTKQSFARDADINHIAKQFGLDPFGKLPIPEEARDVRYYGDLSQVDNDLQTAMNRVFEAQEHFMQLPALVRRRFNDNPALLYDFLQDSANHPEAVELGILAKPKEAVVEVSAPVVDTPPVSA